MCSYQQLYYHERLGYVLRCPECQNLQVVFGNVQLTFVQSVLSDLLQLLDVIAGDYRQIPMEWSRRQIQVPLPYVGISLLLSKQELMEFMSMLDAAELELRSLSLMDLFNCNSNE